MGKKIIHSHSNLNTHKTCPLQYHETLVTKNFTRDWGDGKARKAGDALHKAFENSLLHDAPLPPAYKDNAGAQMAWDRISRMGARLGEYAVLPELALGIDEDMSPVSFWDAGYFRGKIDLVLLQNSKQSAYIADLKNGKSRYGTPDQLRRSTLLLFRHEPLLEYVVAEYLWTSEQKRDTYLFSRNPHPNKPHYATMAELTEELRYDISIVDRCHDTGKWPAVRSGLCKAHCPVNSCPNYGK